MGFASSVDIFSLPNLDYPDRKYLVLDGVHNAVSALTNSIPFLSGQLFTTGRSGIGGEPFDSIHYFYKILFGYRTDVFFDGPFEIDLICGHLSLAF